MRSPFKFLEAYNEHDTEYFFGREQEIEDLYQLLRKSKLVLVYGPSGSGKSSLVQCGLAKRLDITNWLPIFIKRNQNINHSFLQSLDSLSNSSEKTVGEKLTTIFKTSLRPPYLIFDQLEELLIQGDQKEINDFFDHINTILHTEVPCKILLILREEYIAHLYEYEKKLPILFNHRLRVEPMSHKGIEKVINGSFEQFNIQFQGEGSNTTEIINNISDQKGRVSLPYLQVYLDMLYQVAYGRQYGKQKPKFKLPQLFILQEDIFKIGKIENVLEKYLFQQLEWVQKSLSAQFSNIDSASCRNFLDAFVTPEGTKKSLPFLILSSEYHFESFSSDSFFSNLPDSFITKCLQEFEKRRILRLEDTSCTLAHDSLAAIIDRHRTEQQRRLNELQNRIRFSFQEFQETGEHLSEKQLISLEEYLPEMKLEDDLRAFISRSYLEVKKLKKLELERQQKELDRERRFSKQLKLQMKRAKSGNLAAYSILALLRDKNPLRAFRLAQYGLLYQRNNGAAYLALINAFYYQVYRLYGHFFTTPFYKSLEHDSFVYHAAFSQNGEGIATVSKDKRTKIWDQEGNLLSVLEGHNASVWHVDFSPNGQRLVTSSYDKKAIIWNIKGSQVCVLSDHKDSVWMACFSANGKMVATASKDRTAKIWDQEGKLLASLKGHTKSVDKLIFSNDSKLVVTASTDRTAKLWNIEGNLLTTFEGHSGPVKSVAFNEKGDKLISASTDKTAKVWNVDGKELLSLEGHQKTVNLARFSPNENFIITASEDWTAKIWDKNGKLLSTLSHRSAVSYAEFSSTDTEVLTASDDHTAKIWDVRSKGLVTLRGHPAPVWRAYFSPDDKKALTVSSDNTGKLWKLTELKIPVYSGHRSEVYYAIYSPKGRNILSASKDKTAKIWNRYGKVIADLSGHTGSISCANWSKDGKHIVTASWDKSIRIWDQKGNCLRTFDGHDDFVYFADFSPDNKLLASVSKDKKVILWDWKSGEIVQSFFAHSSAVRHVAFSSDHNFFATASNDKNVRVWDIANYKKVLTLKGHTATVNFVSFSNDGRYIATASKDKTIKIWNTQGELLNTLQGHTGPVQCVSFSPNNKYMVSASLDETIKIWSIKDGSSASIRAHSAGVYAAFFSPDGKKIVSASKDKSIRIWDIHPSALIKKVENMNVDDLTENEKTLFGIVEKDWE